MLDTLSTISRALLEASSGVAGWGDALGCVADSLGASAACFNVHGSGASRTMLPATPRYAAMLEEFYGQRWSELDIRSRRGWKRLLQGEPVLLENDLSTPEERARLDIYGDLFARHDLGTWATIGMDVGDELWVCSLARSTRVGDFTKADAARMQEVRQVLRATFVLTRSLAKRYDRQLLASLSLQGVAAMMVDFRGIVVGCNPEAERLLSPDLQVRRGAIQIRDRSAMLQLSALLPPSPRWSNAAPTSIIVRRPQQRPIVVSTMPIGGSAAEALGSCGLLLTLHDLAKARIPDLDLLRAAFGVTPSELRVAQLLTRNMRLEEIATELRIGIDTVRKHLKSIFAKCGCHTQAELARLIGNLPVELDT